MPRSALVPRQYPLCRICDALAVRRLYTAKTPFTSQIVSSVSRSRPRLLSQCTQSIKGAAARVSGRTPCQVAAISTRPYTGSNTEDYAADPVGTNTQQPEERQELSSLTDMTAYLENHKAKVLGHRNIPSEPDISAALHACKVVADYIMDESAQPQITHMVNELDSTASNLLSLDKASQSSSTPGSDDGASGVRIPAQLKQMIDKISDTAYAILVHPTIFITPSLLRQYVHVQSRLGKSETLPGIFQLYSSKPMPRSGSGSQVVYVKQNSNKAASAIEPEVVETALDTAIESKNLDAAVGIIENSYGTTAFVRSKLLRKAGLPVVTFAVTPIAAYGLASSFSVLQDSMDAATATNTAFVGILAYVAFTASIGMVAVMTANDQMKRVTWAPGIPLRTRWIREEERAALDKIAVSWGFAEDTRRQGEEEGADWDALREYIGQRGMILDNPALMEGME
ncbi:uncharacterized protein BCR38DRAFT_437869 [Pseudomassariella vexata]|uniref:Uncharacterized protein n=1 Tax=Pseudomassariella vexata TaxID=1141098 RepID=A0A1Y2DSU4_9PEZI|nr:uncharacterized protein BCR38DRAFT_437869 [Pseudomassariella vexata]ORY62216.1 hypothetical protein BCR38DRAFT_437869 [Pseudomassariella vexata]